MNGRELRFERPAGPNSAATVLLIVGGLGVGVGAFFAPAATGAYLLLVGFLGVCLGLAGALFVALEYVTRARWSVAVRRVPEAMVALLPVGGVLVLIALAAFPSLYPWTDPHIHLHGDLKHTWLQRPFFLGRAVVYVLIWAAVAFLLVRTSRRQDRDPALTHTLANRRWSALFLVLFGLTFWLATYDWLMSREPNWVSTIYGLYNFAGLFASGLAVYLLVVLWLRELGPYRAVVTDTRLHDLGKLFFGMAVFWMYLWYCQYMLIWFVNNPEETPHYLRRTQGFLGTMFWTNVALNGVIPFFVLLPRAMKQNTKVLVNVCVVILLGRWLDLYLMLLPESQSVASWFVGLALTLGAVGLYMLVMCRALAQAPLLPRNDPFLSDSLADGPSHHVPTPTTAPVGGAS